MQNGQPSISELIAMAANANQPPDLTVEEDQERLLAEVEHISRLWEGDDDDAKCVRPAINMMRVMATEYQAGIRCSKVVAGVLVEIQDHMKTWIDRLSATGCLRATALGTYDKHAATYDRWHEDFTQRVHRRLREEAAMSAVRGEGL